LDEGESAVIALAAELENPAVVLDDKKARRVARQMGLSVVGTVGLLLRAKREHMVPEVKSLLESLARTGFRLSKELHREAVRLAGEHEG
jgi:predicted nucleic acid-binding protein